MNYLVSYVTKTNGIRKVAIEADTPQAAIDKAQADDPNYDMLSLCLPAPKQS